MAKEKTGKGLPEFQTLDQEKAYWEARGPLAEGRRGRVNKPSPDQKRSSFLAVRLTGQELTRLRDIAAKKGLGPSTYGRLLITRGIDSEKQLPEIVISDELIKRLSRNLSQTDRNRFVSLVKETSGTEYDETLTVELDTSKEWEESRLLFLKCLLGLLGVRMVQNQVKSPESGVKPKP